MIRPFRFIAHTRNKKPDVWLNVHRNDTAKNWESSSLTTIDVNTCKSQLKTSILGFQKSVYPNPFIPHKPNLSVARFSLA